MWDHSLSSNVVSSRALPAKMVLFWKTIIKIHRVEPKQTVRNGIQEFNCDIRITSSLVGGLTRGSPACHLGVPRVQLCCPNPSRARCVLASAGRAVHPTEILIGILLASPAGRDFQDSGGNSRNLPLTWQLFHWPDLERLGREKTGHRGANIGSDQDPSLPRFLFPSPSLSGFGTSVEDRAISDGIIFLLLTPL